MVPTTPVRKASPTSPPSSRSLAIIEHSLATEDDQSNTQWARCTDSEPEQFSSALDARGTLAVQAQLALIPSNLETSLSIAMRMRTPSPHDRVQTQQRLAIITMRVVRAQSATRCKSNSRFVRVRT